MGSDMGTTDEANMFSLRDGFCGVYGIVTKPSEFGERPRGLDAVRVGRPVTTRGLWPISPP
jgi:hypothetical protein